MQCSVTEIAPDTAVMHGSSFRGDGRKALIDLAAAVNDLLNP